MRAVRAAALVGLLLVTAGVVWQVASAASPHAAPSRVSGGSTRPSPVPTAEQSVRSAWRADTSAGGVSVGECTPGEGVVRAESRGLAEVDVLCTTQVSEASVSRPEAVVWHVRLRWRDGAWLVEGLHP